MYPWAFDLKGAGTFLCGSGAEMFSDIKIVDKNGEQRHNPAGASGCLVVTIFLALIATGALFMSERLLSVAVFGGLTLVSAYGYVSLSSRGYAPAARAGAHNMFTAANGGRRPHSSECQYLPRSG